MTPQFIHLRVHTEYSLVDGIVRIKPLVNNAVSLGMPALAVTDQSNMYSFVKFYKAALSVGVKPICGADIWLQNGKEGDGFASRMTLLAMNQQGYHHLIQLISRGWTEGQQDGHVTIQHTWLEELSDGLIALSGGKEGDIGRALLSDDKDSATCFLEKWKSVFPQRFYLEIQRTQREGDTEYVNAAVVLASEYGIPLVATNDVRFLEQDDFAAHETRVCIGEGNALDDPRHVRQYSDQQYFKTPDEMCALFHDLPEALENTIEIAKRCNLDVTFGVPFLPNFPIPNGLSIDEYFRKVSFEGLEERLKIILPENDAVKRQSYIDRLNFELDIIIQMGFPGYFLIVMDFIRWAKDNDIPVGPGRGSGAGSLVAYVQKITDLDPLAYDLLFERFLNPERVSMPDFDVDFCMEGRDQVIEYVSNKYGSSAVSQIITFGTMAAKAVIRDVARAQGKSYGLADRLSKMIPFEVGMTLNKAHQQEEILRKFLEEDAEASEIWDMSLKLEGITRGTGKHAGGVVIAPTKLTDFSPILCEEDGSGLITQFDKDDVEAVGLVKFDFLGLRTLTIIKWALEAINDDRALHDLDSIDISLIPLDDEKTFLMLQKAETTAVFQLESRGMKELIKKLKPDCLEDLIALVALFRPGPLQSGMVDDFINRKHDYQYEGLKPVLSSTYGIILYQEQVMQIAQIMAGYTLGQADMLRRAMGKKKVEEMAKQRSSFIQGCQDNEINAVLAGNIFDLVEKFAGYGFNKSHSAAYGLISYQTAWLKTHYPAHFMAAVLSADMQNTDKIVILVEECQHMKLVVDAPDINFSEYKFTVRSDLCVVYGLGAIKGIGEGLVDAIVAARNEAVFKDLFDFCARIDVKRINKRSLEALIRCGAFDSLNAYRAILLASIEEAMHAAEQALQNKKSGHLDLFGDVSITADTGTCARYLNVQPLTLKERLVGEKETLGLYFTGHPIDEYAQEIRYFAKKCIVDLKPSRELQSVAGLVVSWRVMRNKKGDKMGFLTLDDHSGRIEVSLFSETFSEYSEQIQMDRLMVVNGEVSYDDYSGSIRLRAKKIMTLEESRASCVKAMRLLVSEQRYDRLNLDELAFLLEKYPGECPVILEYTGKNACASLSFGSEWNIDLHDKLLQDLRIKLGQDNVVLSY
ncbi:UNVERIFIED_CONTAM: hypothetical protein GTU68_010964 [Idotea baltica]|nr:hypothetical protein [Idotea baltica]